MVGRDAIAKQLASRFRLRTGFRVQLGGIHHEVQEHANAPLSRSKVQYLRTLLDCLEDDNKENYESILTLTDDAEVEEISVEHFQFLNEVFGTREELSLIFPPVIPVQDVIVDNPQAIPQPVRNGSLELEVKLPQIDIPKFSGCSLLWESFRDLFTTLVVNQNKLTGAQKLQYLKSSLIGDAAKLVQSITVTNDNFDRAWKVIISRYDNKREIINSHIQRLTSQDAISCESASELLRLIDTTRECVEALTTRTDIDDLLDYLLVFMTSSKPDQETRKQWELTIPNNDDLPTFAQLQTFLENRARSLVAAGVVDKQVSVPTSKNGTQGPKKVHQVGTKLECPKCTASHFLSKCSQFKELNANERYKFVKSKSLCVICLTNGHVAKDCKKDWTCRTCNKKHHTLLHFENKVPNGEKPQAGGKTVLFSNQMAFPQVLLATALVQILDANGDWQQCRALFDQGAETSLISENCMSRLRLPRRRAKIDISGVGDTNVETAKGVVSFFLAASDYSHECKMQALIISKVSTVIPRYKCAVSEWPHLRGLTLADPTFFQPNDIDLLIGAEYVAFLMNSGKIEGPEGSPVAQETKLGWILTGPVSGNVNHVRVLTSQCNVDETLRKFWEIEDIPACESHMTTEEQAVESHFAATYQRDDTGRFIVQLPFKSPDVRLGESKQKAIQRWNAVERRISKDSNLYEQYQGCLQEYLDLSHMEYVPDDELDNPNCYYIPHHAVIKESSSTTKCRVVFDASAKTTNGFSLNDVVMLGPKLQDELTTILLRFGIHIEPMVADIAKMYRQFLIHPKHRDFQRIVWRPTVNSPLRVLRLKTVTFGVAIAPYLAIKCTQMLAEEEKLRFPLAAPVIQQDLYVDNLCSGAGSLDDALNLQREILELMQAGGLLMRQWSAHNPALLSGLSESLRETQIPFPDDSDISIKTLGIFWDPVDDTFSFRINSKMSNEVLTKRSLLSNISKLFDPLGWLAPIHILSKILLQETWKLKTVSWDSVLPDEIQSQWQTYRSELPLIESLKIPRGFVSVSAIRYELHGFCDASERAYSAVTYIRRLDADGSVTMHILMSKTRVSPISHLTIPRLELCGALLLARLMQSIQSSIPIEFGAVHAWTDSQIVRYWITGDPGRWKVFVANRVSQIQKLIPSSQWHHIAGVDNPADVASRGISPAQLSCHPLWWHGPPWLQDATFVIPESIGSVVNVFDSKLEERRVLFLVNPRSSRELKLAEKRDGTSIFARYSSLQKLIRIATYCRRFRNNCDPTKEKIVGPIFSGEARASLNALIKVSQLREFEDEKQLLLAGKLINPKSRIANLNPFLRDEIIRVGGRLRNASIPDAQKFPILLPKYHLLTDLIIADIHSTTLHGGQQLVMSTMGQNYWIVGMKDVVRNVVRSCVTCRRLTADLGVQMMADLPVDRVTPDLAFQKCGVDYAGPIHLLTQKSRKSKMTKAYIVIFVCFTTRAIHLEVASDLSTGTFIAVLQRFVARRGKPSRIYSDNARHFVRADKELKHALKQIMSTSRDNDMTNFLLQQKIEWHFNPPAAPHFGGLWEAGIKSVKFHLKRVVKDAKMNFEEMDTLLKNIEAALNSRPITSMSSDPSDMQALTPGHFLIGRPLNAIPQLDVRTKPITHLSRWQFLTSLFQHFWKRWKNEYLTRLQQRPKWANPQRNLVIGEMVLLKKDHHSPLEWNLGRIIKIHPGTDGKVRVVTVKTALSEFVRPITKLCLLPIDNSEH